MQPQQTAAVADPPARPVAVVVLAAGVGSRLAAVGLAGPKWLLEVAGRTIADHQLAALAAAGDAVGSVVVVTGFEADRVVAAVRGRSAAPPVEFVRNEGYAARNNWWTLALGLRHLLAAGHPGPVVILNSDLVPGSGLLEDFVRAASTMTADALLAVDEQRPLTAEAMKVTGTQSAGRLAIEAIGKVGVDRPLGEYVGVAALNTQAVGPMLALLEEHERDPARHDLWYDLAFGRLAADGHAVLGWSAGDRLWVEVDDLGDLDAAQLVRPGRP